jgi:hypothetical protein
LRTCALAATLSLAVASCGDDDGAEGGTDATVPATETSAVEEAGADEVAVEMGEWFIDAPSTVASGRLTLNVSNIGEELHILVVARGDSYESLPLLYNGGVDEEALGDDAVGETGLIPRGTGTASVELELEPGNYVFFCPIQSGSESHAGLGQTLSVTAT